LSGSQAAIAEYAKQTGGVTITDLGQLSNFANAINNGNFFINGNKFIYTSSVFGTGSLSPLGTYDMKTVTTTKTVYFGSGNDNSSGTGGSDEKSVSDNVGLADALLGPVGGGAANILKNRGIYLPRNEVYRAGREIIVRTPIANIRTTSRLLNTARVGGKILGVAGVVATGYQVYGDIDNGKYYSAGARTTVAGIAVGAAFIPVVGWGVAAGIGVADYIWGDQFYNYVETKMR
jgi:hypothetical protein